MNKGKVGVVDLFCGIGGLSYGLHKVGFDIIAGIDIESSCKYAFETNTGARFVSQDVNSVSADQVNGYFRGYDFRVLAGCAPCQPFSTYSHTNRNKKKEQYSLLSQFGRLVESVKPEIVTMENVTQIAQFKKMPVLENFIDTLSRNGYRIDVRNVYCPDYGIPQTRKRLVLVASRIGDIHLIPPTHTPDQYVTVRESISHLPPIKSGEKCEKDPLHQARRLSPLNLRRIQATPENGSWKDWPEDLRLECHKKGSGAKFGSVYGRMDWDAPAPTMTTQCTGLGNGRFGHPDQDRAISVREAAILQTFPDDYKFVLDGEDYSITKVSRQIGNAVPPRLGEITGESIIRHLQEYGRI